MPDESSPSSPPDQSGRGLPETDRGQPSVEAAMINPTPCDAALENWFLSNGEDAVAAPDQLLNSVAPWIPLIGIPANDA